MAEYKKGDNTPLSKNFISNEFDCKCKKYCKTTKIDPQLIIYLQKIRDYFGRAVIINSAYRCKKHNSDVGGASKSKHLYGQAADIKVSGINPLKVAQYAEFIGVKGIGQYSNFVHIDTRDNKFFWYGNEQKEKSTFGGQGSFKDVSNSKAEVNTEMAVKVGHASISEKGTITGKAGDQNGKEVCIRNWYAHSKGWVTLRCIVPGMAEYIATAMEAICKNDNVGYDQYENGDLWDDLESNGWDIYNIKSPTETDCARLVRVCVQWAAKQVGLDILIPDFYTATLVNVLLGTGLFEKLTSDKYNKQDDFLERGMVQCTKTKGHTWVILGNGSEVKSANTSASEPVSKPMGTKSLGYRILKNGCEGEDVKELQCLLLKLDSQKYNLGRWGADGEFGDATEIAVERFQKNYGCEVDGIVGEETLSALYKAFENSDEVVVDANKVKIIDGNCNVRLKPNTDGAKIGIAYENDIYNFAGEISETGWHKIYFNDEIGWVSGKYSILIKGNSETNGNTPEGEYLPKGKIADVSKHQGDIDWSKASKELDFVIIRACNNTTLDTKFEEYVSECKTYAIPFGVYQYSKATSTSAAIKEAEYLWGITNKHTPNFYVLDCEENGMTRDVASAWVRRMKELGAKKLGFYIAHHKYNTYKLNVAEVDFVWIPRYGKNGGTIASSTKPSFECDLWQFTSAGLLAGVSGNVDLNVITESGKDMAWFIG